MAAVTTMPASPVVFDNYIDQYVGVHYKNPLLHKSGSSKTTGGIPATGTKEEAMNFTPYQQEEKDDTQMGTATERPPLHQDNVPQIHGHRRQKTYPNSNAMDVSEDKEPADDSDIFDNDVSDDALFDEEPEPAPKVEAKKKPSHHMFPSDELCGRYEFVRYLGKGAYGHVCEARSVKTGGKVAIKKILNVFENREEARRILREVRILRILSKHKKIADVLDVLPPKDLRNFTTLSIVFEYVDTDLAKIIDFTDQYFSIRHVQYFLWQLLLSIKYLHSSKIIHRDLKPANILINENCSLRICDFGLARGLNTRNRKSQESDLMSNSPPRLPRPLTKHVVTRYYRAPEILLKADYSTSADMWSVGCILAELLSMQKSHLPRREMRKPLFPGTYSSFSPAPKAYYEDSSRDQLNMILSIVGQPSDEDVDAVGCSKRTADYLKNKTPRLEKIDYAGRYPSREDQEYCWAQLHHDGKWVYFNTTFTKKLEAAYLQCRKQSNQNQNHVYKLAHGGGSWLVDFKNMRISSAKGQEIHIRRRNAGFEMLEGLLQFNPDKRLTADQALAHPFMRTYHNTEEMQTHDPVHFEFEDYDLTSAQIRELIIDEMLQYNPELKRELEAKGRKLSRERSNNRFI